MGLSPPEDGDLARVRAKGCISQRCPCGERFVARRPDQVYCTQECKRRFARKRYAARNPGRGQYLSPVSKPTAWKVCRYGACGNEFETNKDEKVYCSVACASAANEERYHGPLSLRFMVLARDGFRCRYCGRGPKEGAVLQIEHVVPRNRNGGHRSINLRAACVECNLGKMDVLISEHRKRAKEV